MDPTFILPTGESDSVFGFSKCVPEYLRVENDMETPSASVIHPRQIKELVEQNEIGRITRANFQLFLNNPNRIVQPELGRYGKIYPLEVDYDFGLEGLMSKAAAAYRDPCYKENHFYKVHEYVTPAHYRLPYRGTRKVNVELFEFDDRRMSGGQIDEMLKADGYQGEDIAVFFTFLFRYQLASRRRCVTATGARWTDVNHHVRVPYADFRVPEGDIDLLPQWDDHHDLYWHHQFLVSPIAT